ncbi:MAG: sigma-70 family RNA polymerase sigma factor [Candidatus Cybelea sp.]
MSATDSRDAFVDRIDRHRGILLKVAGAFSRNPVDREDLLQEIAVALWRAHDRFDARSSFATWMYRVAMNVAISFQRSETRKSRLVPADNSLFETIAQPRDEPADDRLALIRELIRRLDPPNRALMLLYLDDYPYAEIAKILGISETNVATKIGRIKDRLKRDLAGAVR